MNVIDVNNEFQELSAKNENIDLIEDIKQALVEIHEEEQLALKSDNPLHSNGLIQARIILETVLSKHNIQRPIRIDNNPHIEKSLNPSPTRNRF